VSETHDHDAPAMLPHALAPPKGTAAASTIAPPGQLTTSHRVALECRAPPAPQRWPAVTRNRPPVALEWRGQGRAKFLFKNAMERFRPRLQHVCSSPSVPVLFTSLVLGMKRMRALGPS